MGRTRTEYPEPTPLLALPAAAMRAVLKEGYGREQLQKDLVAGFLVGVIALPLAMALAIAVGVAPQYGLYTAIIAGFVTPLLGGSRTQVVGPTAAFIVVLAPVYTRFGMGGLVVSGLLAGVMLIVLGLLRAGRLIEFIPFPVTTGFTAGIATVIAFLQLKDLFGLKLASAPEHFSERVVAMWTARGTTDWHELTIGLVTLVVLLLPRLPEPHLSRLPKLLVKVPAPLLALPIGALTALALSRGLEGFHVETIGTRFHSVVDGVSVAGIPRSLPSFTWPWNMPGADGQPVGLSLELVRTLVPSAFTIAMLAAIESLLSAVVADGMARTRHDPDAELVALGVGNVLAPFFGGIPATGAMARTASNYKFGGRTPVAAMAHAVTVLLAIVLLAPLLAYLPMASLAALLLVVAWNMSEAEHFVHTIRVASKSDVAVLLACYGLTVLFDMVIAVTAGVLLASVLFIRRMATTSHGRLVKDTHRDLPGPLPKGVVVYDLVGPLFFGAAERALGAMRAIDGSVKVLVLNLEQVLTVDATGLVALEGVLEEMRHHGIKVLLCGAPPAAKRLFDRAGLKPEPGKLAYCDDLEAAWNLLGGIIEKHQRKHVGPVRLHALQRHKLSIRNPRHTG
ncbi:MAG: C4-dicarboxylic acid transporter DauA [Myxococcota bacterium]